MDSPQVSLRFSHCDTGKQANGLDAAKPPGDCEHNEISPSYTMYSRSFRSTSLNGCPLFTNTTTHPKSLLHMASSTMIPSTHLPTSTQ